MSSGQVESGEFRIGQKFVIQIYIVGQDSLIRDTLWFACEIIRKKWIIYLRFLIRFDFVLQVNHDSWVNRDWRRIKIKPNQMKEIKLNRESKLIKIKMNRESKWIKIRIKSNKTHIFLWGLKMVCNKIFVYNLSVTNKSG